MLITSSVTQPPMPAAERIGYAVKHSPKAATMILIKTALRREIKKISFIFHIQHRLQLVGALIGTYHAEDAGNDGFVAPHMLVGAKSDIRVHS